MKKTNILSEQLDIQLQFRFFIIFLKVCGITALFAIIFVFAPYKLMNSIYRLMEIGEMPSQPIVGYLARSTSWFYAVLGGLILITASDLKRYRVILLYIGIIQILFGLIIFGIDYFEGMPHYWTAVEGSSNLIIGLIIFYYSKRIVQ